MKKNNINSKINLRFLNIIILTLMLSFLSIFMFKIIIGAEDNLAGLPELRFTYEKGELVNIDIVEDIVINHHYIKDKNTIYILEEVNNYGLSVDVEKNGEKVINQSNMYVFSSIDETTLIKITVGEEGKDDRVILIVIEVDVPFPDGLILEESETTISFINDSKYPWVFDSQEKTRFAYKSTNKVIDDAHYEFMRVDITEPGILYFDYKTSSNSGENFLGIIVNGDLINEYEKEKYSGIIGWQTTYLLLSENYNEVHIYYDKGHISSSDNEDTVWIANFGFTAGSTSNQVSIDLSIDGGEYGSVTGLDLNSNLVDLLTPITLNAIPNNDALFIGWRDTVNNKFISYEFSYNFVAYKNMSIEAVFISKNHVARIGINTYDSLEEAMFASISGDIVVLMQDIILTSNLTIPKGVMLLIPYSETDYFGYIEVPYLNGTAIINPNGTTSGQPSLFRTLTIPSNVTLTIEGTVMVNAVTGRPSAGTYNQDISGGYGQIILDGEIKVENGGLLDVFGFVKGSGKVTAYEGAEVGDLYVVKNWRGGTVGLEVFTLGIFPFNQYECHNIETMIVIRNGASYYGNVKMYALDQFFYTKFYQISNFDENNPEEKSKAGLIKLTTSDSYAIKKYDPNTKHTTLTLCGGASEIGGTLEVSGMEATTKDFLYPIDGHVTIILTNGEYQINHKLKFLPGSKLIVEESAVLYIENTLKNGINAELIFYDIFLDAFMDSTMYPINREPAIFELYGVLIVENAFGGYIDKVGKNTEVVIGKNASVYVLSKEIGPKNNVSDVVEHKIFITLTEFEVVNGLIYQWFYGDGYSVDKNELTDDAIGNAFYLVRFPDDPEIELITTTINNENALQVNVYNKNEDEITYKYIWYKDGKEILGYNYDYLIIDNYGLGTYYCEVHALYGEEDVFEDSNSITITSKPINDQLITIEPISEAIFTGSEIKPIIIVKDGEDLLEQGVDYLVSYSNNINVGKATVTITGINDYEGCMEVFFNINPKTVSVNWIDDDFTFDGTNQLLKVKAYIENDIEVVVVIDEFINYGEYTAFASLDNPNYILDNTTMTYHMKAKTIEVIWLTSNDFTYNGFEQSSRILVSTETGIEISISFDKEFKNVGTYLVTLTSNDANYVIINNTNSYDIKPLALEVNWVSLENLVYNGSIQSSNVNAHIEGVGLDGIINLDINFDKEFKNAGSYFVTASLNDNNYQLLSNTKAYSINKAMIKVIVDNKVSAYNEPLVNLTYQIDGMLYDGDNLNVVLSTTATPQSNVGNYSINATASNSNYEITLIPAIYTIEKAKQYLAPLSLDNFIITFNQITVIPLDGAVYSFDGINYSEKNIFDNLIPLTKYQIYVKLLSNDNYYESNSVSMEVMTKADTREFDAIVNSLQVENVTQLFVEIKQALTILNEIGREHFDQDSLVKLDELVQAYNDYLSSVHQDFNTAVNIGGFVTNHVDVIDIITKLSTIVNLMAVTFVMLIARKLKRE